MSFIQKRTQFLIIALGLFCISSCEQAPAIKDIKQQTISEPTPNISHQAHAIVTPRAEDPAIDEPQLKKYSAQRSPKKRSLRGSSQRSFSKSILEQYKKTQNSDGSWGQSPQGKIGLSSLILFTMLTHQETPKSRKYGSCALCDSRLLI